MCGIVGWIDWEQDLTQHGPVIANMMATLRHRGPDAQGQWLSRHAALAHQRLFVIDPAGGAQPMVYQADGRTYALTYNGELYNFRELRRTLEACGHTFRTQSDTEVLLHAYVEWGEDCVSRLNGIFAFGLWDAQKQQLLLARDHLGVKPLFYAPRQHAVFFASEIKALLAHPEVPAEVDADGLAELLSAGPIHPPGFAIYRHLHEVRPGHMLLFDCQRTRVMQYWSLRSAPHTDDLTTTIEHIRTLLDDTVRRQLIADVPVVAMLSGGLDSSGLTALAAREFHHQGKQLHTYAIDFVDSAQHFVSDAMHASLDTPWAERLAAYVGATHHTILVDTHALLDNLLVPTYAHDVPGLGQLETSLYLLCKAMKQDATVALSGEAADEIFGGYPWFHDTASLTATTFPWMVTFGGAAPSPQRFLWLSADTQQQVQPQAYMERRYQEAIAAVPRLAGEEPVAAKRREIFYLNLTHWLPMLLDRKDRMSMAVGFEVRVPFCDYRLVEYVWNIPWEMHTVDHLEKGLLRRAVADVLPEDIRQRRKSAYPLSHHPAYRAGICRWALQILHDPNAAIRPLINVPVVRAIAAGKVPAIPAQFVVGLLERLIQLDAWFTHYHVRMV
jgi:asparagine synthase (glutamine-hydrolysing)